MAEVVDVGFSREGDCERSRRPIGTVVLGLVMLLLGSGLAAVGIHRLIQRLSSDATQLTLLNGLATFHVVSNILLVLAAAIGLLRGSRWGWWMAVAFSYVLLAKFVLIPPFYRGFVGQAGWLALNAGLCGGLLLYLNKQNVRAFFRIGAQVLQTHAIMFAFCVVFASAVPAAVRFVDASRTTQLQPEARHSMNSPNTLVLKSASRDAVFPMEGEGSLWTRSWPNSWPNSWPKTSSRKTHDEVVINIEAALPAIKGEIEYDCSPVITLSWLEKTFAFDDLLNRTVNIPRSFDETVGDHMTSFYYFEHLDFDDVRIEFIERDGERYRIKVTGTVPDLEAAGADAKMTIEIDTIVHRTER
jgi:hypothetical protein